MKLALIHSDAKGLTLHPDLKGIHNVDVCLTDVHGALEALGHEVVCIPARDGMFAQLKRLKPRIDLAFNLADDGYGCNTQLEPHIPAMLDILGIPYTGSDFVCLANCLDKVRTKQLLIANNLPTPDYAVFEGRISSKSKLPRLRFPLIIKPAREDASIGLKKDSVVGDKAGLIKKVNSIVNEFKQPALVEEFIDGREILVGILGRAKPIVLPITEIVFDLPAMQRKFLYYDTKWLYDSDHYRRTVAKCPAELDEACTDTLHSMAKKAYELLGVRDYGKVEFRLNEQGKPYIIEINPNSDLSKGVELHRMAKANNMDYTDFIGQIIESALNTEQSS